jgi:hypothetical protein
MHKSADRHRQEAKMKIVRLLIALSGQTAQFALGVFAVAVAAGFAFAADIPQEGSYDFTSCWSGVSNAITFSNTHSANSYEMTGTSQSHPPGGFADKHTFRCVGVNHSLGGRAGGTAVCEAVDPQGDKRLTYFSFEGEKAVREAVAGTGKYDGMIMTGSSVKPLGPFPVIKPGTFQSCNRQTGNYKLK